MIRRSRPIPPQPRQVSSPARPDRTQLLLKITSDPAQLASVRKKVEHFAASVGFAVECCDAVGLALNEALANVIRHAYGGAKDRPIEISARFGDGELRLSIRDWGTPFDPQTLPQPKSGASKLLKPGGLGLLCMGRLMDSVQYQRLSDGMLLTMVKRAGGVNGVAR